MSTTKEHLTNLCNRLTNERNTLLEHLAASPVSDYEDADLRRISDLHNALLAAEAVLETHMPRLGSGSEE
jgi:hypothetical protein